MGVEEEVDKELGRTIGQTETCFLEGNRYKGNFKATRKGAKYWGGSEYTTHLYIRRWWEGAGTIENNQIKKRYQFLLHTNDFCDCCFPEYVQSLEGSIVYFHRKDSYRSVAKQPEIKNKRAVIDLSLNKLLNQLKENSKKDPIPTVIPQPLEILELMGMDLIQLVSPEDIIDSLYFNLEKKLYVENKIGGFLEKLWLECLDQSYTYMFEGYLVKSNNERRAFLKISPCDDKLTVITKKRGFDLGTLGKSLVYFPLNEENYKKIKNKDFYELGKLIISDRQSKLRNQQLLSINRNLFMGELINDQKKVLVFGGPVDKYKLDKGYDGRIVPDLIESISQKIKN